MIYIDPPYNTGKDFVYKDNYSDNLSNYLDLTGQLDEAGRKLSTNTESDGRYHSNWLNMMYPRLKLAQNLLIENGAIFISIDDNEYSNLKKICNEIFGEDNYRNTFAIRRYDKNLNRQFIENGLKSFNVGFEYIVCYSKTDKFNFAPVFKESSEERQNVGYWKGFWNDANRPTMRYDILGYTPDSGQWKWKKEVALEAVENYKEYIEKHSHLKTIEDYWIETGKTKKFIRRNLNGQGKNKGVENWIAPSEGILRNTNWTDLFASKHEVETQGLFDFPKNVELINLLISTCCNEDDLILDFFAGSGTTAESVMQLNAQDNANRKFICVQLPEKTELGSEAYNRSYYDISQIAKDRIRKVGEKIISEKNGLIKKLKNKVEGKILQDDVIEKIEDIQNVIENLDIGFKVFNLDSSNINTWDGDPDKLEQTLFNAASNIKENRTEDDILYEILLKHGLDLTQTIEQKEIYDKLVFNIGGGALFICLGDDITTTVADGIGKWKEELKPATCKVIFKDTGFTDVEKTNSMQILKRYGIEEVNTI